jgi:hypothetical protein
MMNLEGYGRKWLWSKLRDYFVFALNDWADSRKTSINSQFFGQDLNSEPPKHKARLFGCYTL